jgi:hypothetical protein
MEFTLYCHQITSGSDEGLFFSRTLEQAKAEVAEYIEELRHNDPTAEPEGPLAIYEMDLRGPDLDKLIEVPNPKSRSFKLAC